MIARRPSAIRPEETLVTPIRSDPVRFLTHIRSNTVLQRTRTVPTIARRRNPFVGRGRDGIRRHEAT